MESDIWTVIFAILLLSTQSAAAQEYYANVVVTVDEAGIVEITGTTNHPALEGTFQNYTSKENGIWTLNISPEGNFSDFLYEIHLPQGSSISYIKVPGKLSIENSGYLSIVGSGKDDEMSLLVQYQIKPIKYEWIIPYAFALFILSAAVYLVISRKKPKNILKIQIDKESLTEREKKIVKILEKNNNGITQSKLQKELNLPKASLSRNIRSLFRKGIITKTEKGMTNHISLKKQ